MDEYKNVLNKINKYDTLFIKIITIPEHKSYDWYRGTNDTKHWDDFSNRKYDEDYEKNYNENASYHAEFSKISSISFGGFKNDTSNQDFSYVKVINDDSEINLLTKFFNVLELFREKKLDGYICGHNIYNYDIPFICKRALKHNLKIPKIIKNNLVTKPWEGNIIDTLNLWKFTGSEYQSLDTIAKFLNLKQNISLKFDPIIEYDNINLHNKVAAENVKITMELYDKLRDI